MTFAQWQQKKINILEQNWMKNGHLDVFFNKLKEYLLNVTFTNNISLKYYKNKSRGFC